MKITKTLDIAQDGDGWIVASSPSVDRDRDRVMPMGGDLTNFNKNPVLIFGHNYHEPWAVIGRVAQTSVDSTGIRMKPELRAPANENDPMHIIKALWDQGLLRAGSIGFIPIESQANEFGGRDFTKWELLELSLTPIPANQDAIRLAVKALTESEAIADTETLTDDPVDEAPIADLNELTPEQEQVLIAALAALTEELTDLFTED